MTVLRRASVLCVSCLLAVGVFAPATAAAQPAGFEFVTVRKTVVGSTSNTPSGPFLISATCTGLAPQTVTLSGPNNLQFSFTVPIGGSCMVAEIPPLPSLPLACTWSTSYPNGQTARKLVIVEVRNTFSCSTSAAAIVVQPATVNVNSQGANTAVLNFSRVTTHVPAEAMWCGRIVTVSGRVTGCDPSTLYGEAPTPDARTLSPTGVFTDVMSIPPAVARRAYEAALGGTASRFYYVRRFVKSAGGPAVPDQYVAVSLLLGGGAAVGPFALTNARLHLPTEVPVLFVGRGDRLPPLVVDLQYTGTGRLRGRWEIVFPGEEQPSDNDLRSEESLPPAERGLQRRYLDIQRFNVPLPPFGRFTLPGPDPSRIPTNIDGSYLILLRIETPAAGFRLPTFRYVVGGNRTQLTDAAPGSLRLRLPSPDATVPADSALRLSWIDVSDASRYRVEIEKVPDGKRVMSAIVPQGSGVYNVPPFALAAITDAWRWRVVALDADGREMGQSEWRAATKRSAQVRK